MSETEIFSIQSMNFEEFVVEKEPNLNKVKWTNFLAFEVYGVKIGLRSNREFALNK